MDQATYLYSRFRLHWGFIVRHKGSTASQYSHPLPPPTTVVGFFSEPLYKYLGVPEGFSRGLEKAGTLRGPYKCSLEATLAASAASLPGKVVGIASHQEISRILGAPYKTGGEESKIAKGGGKVGRKEFYDAVSSMLPVQALGESVAPSIDLVLVWVLDTQRLVECLEDLGMRGISGDMVRKALGAASWGGERIGSKEGLGAVIDARVGPPRIIGRGEEFPTMLYTPVKCATPLDPEMVFRVSTWGLSYDNSEYYVPGRPGTGGTLYIAPTSPARMRLDGEGCVAYEVNRERGLVAVGWRG